MTAGRSDLVDVELWQHGESEQALLFSLDGKRENAKWVPKSQIEKHRVKRAWYSVTMPEWLAIDKGFV